MTENLINNLSSRGIKLKGGDGVQQAYYSNKMTKTSKKDKEKKCGICYGYGFWPDGTAPMGPIDAKDKMPTVECPECRANSNPTKVKPMTKTNEAKRVKVKILFSLITDADSLTDEKTLEEEWNGDYANVARYLLKEEGVWWGNDDKFEVEGAEIINTPARPVGSFSDKKHLTALERLDILPQGVFILMPISVARKFIEETEGQNDKN